MSDVSGIPYMGPMGMGGFFSNPYGGGGMNMSAGQISSNYMPEIANNQNVVNNLFNTPGGGGGFGRATDYYSQLGANYLAAVPSSWENPYAHGAIVPQSLRVEGGNYADPSPYATSRDVWNVGASGFSYPGAGGIDWGGLFGSSGGGMGGNAYNYGSLYGSGGAATPPSSYDYGSMFGKGADFGAGMFGGLAGGMGGAYQGPNNQMDWSHLFSGGGGGGGMSMPGGLNAPMTMPQQQSPDYGSLFGRGAGGMGSSTTADPYPAMSMPGGLNSPMSGMDAPMEGAPSSTSDWSTLFGPDTGGMAMPGGLNSPMTVPESQAPAYDYGSLFGKGTEGAAQPAPDGTRTYDLAPMFEGGGGGGFGTGGADTSQLFGGAATGQGGNAFSYNPEPTGAQDTFGQSADAMAEQARARLAGLMGSQDDRAVELNVDPQDKVTPETPAATPAEAVPLPRGRPEGADAPRPPADIPPQDLTYLKGKGPGDLKGVNQRFAKALQEFTREYNAGQGDYSIALRSGLRSEGQGFHTSGKAMDINLIDRRTGERLNDYQTRDPVVFRAYQDNANQFHTFLEKNYPDLAQAHRWGGYFWNGGPGSYGSQDIMHHDLGGDRIGMGAGGWKEGLGQRSADAYGLPTGGGTATPPPQFTFDWSNAPIKDAQPIQPTYKSADGTSLYQIAPDGSHIPVPIGKGMNETTEYDPFRGTSTFAAPTVEERPGVNQGQNVTPPPADIPPPGLVGPGFNALDAAANPPAPVKHSGLELARANIDTPIEQIAMERGGQKAVDQINFMAMGKTPRQLSEQYGGMFMDRAEPLFKSLGITRQDFEQAAKSAPTKQDIKMRFGEGFGDMGGEDPSAGAFSPFEGFRQSADFEDRRNELAQLQAGATSYEPLPEAAPTPLGTALGLEDLPGAGGNTFEERFPDSSVFAPAPPTRADLAAARYSDEGYGTSTGRAPPVTLSPEHMRTMAEIESTQNPNLHDKGSSYKGLYQLDEGEFRKYGGTGSIFNAEQNTKAATAKMYAEGQRAQDILGRALTPVEQYMVHQQGLAGTLSHLRNPDQPAWKSFQQASKWNDADAKTAIWDNLSDAMKAQFGNNVNNITSRDFISMWNTKYYQKMVESGLSPGGLSDLP